MDKFYHAIAGMNIFFACMYMGVSDVVGLIAVFVAGLCKELWDMSGHGDPDALDFVATVVPVVCMVLFRYLLGVL